MDLDDKIKTPPTMQPADEADDREMEQDPQAMERTPGDDAGDKQSDLDVPGGKGLVRPEDAETTENMPT